MGGPAAEGGSSRAAGLHAHAALTSAPEPPRRPAWPCQGLTNQLHTAQRRAAAPTPNNAPPPPALPSAAGLGQAPECKPSGHGPALTEHCQIHSPSEAVGSCTMRAGLPAWPCLLAQ